MNEIIIHKIVGEPEIRRALKILADNGIEPDECGTVLQAVGYALLNAEFGPLIKEAEEK